MKWLVTAFEPFGGASTNSSLIVHTALRARFPDLLFHAPVPVGFASAWTHIEAVLKANPGVDGVLSLGEAGNRGRISLERVALNWNDARMPDNDRCVPAQAKIKPQAPDLHWSNIPWEEFELSPSIERSYSAGTYVCNNVMFRALDWALPLGKKAGFVHIPVLKSQRDSVFETSPRLDDAQAVEEVARILEFIRKL